MTILFLNNRKETETIALKFDTTSFGNRNKASCLKCDDEIIETFLHKDNEAIEAFWK